MFFKNHGILGINARNLLYIRPFNRAKAVKLADSKLNTKSFLSTRGIPVPKLYATIRNPVELKKFDFSSLPDTFVLKPNRGAGGEGILPVWSHQHQNYLLSDGKSITQEEFAEHISDILDGRFSISGVTDIAFFEQRIISAEKIAKFAYKGLPDIRVVVYNLVPVMAMLRLPTKKSKGKANLHQGAICVGIDIAKGEATHAVQGTNLIDEIPGSGPIKGLKIPYWDEILLIASKIQMETNLGYLAADIALDQNIGPVLLEINARAGLGVQIANLAPLRRRLERIKGIKVPTPEKGVRIAKDLFGNVFEKGIKHISGKEVVSTLEPINILVGSKPYRAMASLDLNREKTEIDAAFARKIKLLENEQNINKTSESLKIKFLLSGTRVQTIAKITNLDLKDVSVIIGHRDLQRFLIDPTKSPKNTGKNINTYVSHSVIQHPNFKEIDEKICNIDEKIKLLYHLRPLNLDQEQQKFFENRIKNPQFRYPELQFDPYNLRDQLNELQLGESVLGYLFTQKRKEILQKIDLLEHRGSSYFIQKSNILFGEVDHNLLGEAKEKLQQKPLHFKSESHFLNQEQVAKRLQQFLEVKELKKWSIKFKKNMASDCVVGKQGILFLREGIMISESRYQMLVAHEVETHIFTAENGALQPYHLFQRGTGNYLSTQEGLAIYNQENAVNELTEKHFWNAALVILIHTAQTNSFRQVYEAAQKLGYSRDKAFQVALKTKRGLEDTSESGAFTKDLVYFQGHNMIKHFVEQGNDLKRLYIGKINLADLEKIETLPFLRAPKYFTKF